jgi:hypothetical protein
MFPPVRKPIQQLLSPPNPGASAIYTLTSKAVATVIPIARDLHQRGSLMRTRGGFAAPPCPTISLFSFPGTSLPWFSQYSGRRGRLTFSVLLTASRVYGRYCSLVEHLGCKAIGWHNRAC